MNYNLLQQKINISKKTKTSICEELEVSRRGFDSMLNQQTLRIDVFEKLCKILEVEPCEFLDCGAADSDLLKKVRDLEQDIDKYKSSIKAKEEIIEVLQDHVDTLKGRKKTYTRAQIEEEYQRKLAEIETQSKESLDKEDKKAG